jgi:hypothetical protein
MGSKFAAYALLMLLALSAIVPVSGLKVDNSIIRINVTPGEHIVQEMIVSLSEGESAVGGQADLMGFGTNINGNVAPLTAEDDKSPYSAREFFNVSPSSFFLEPGKPVSVVLEGDIPEDVGSGGRYALVHIHTLPQGNGSVGFVTAIIVPIYLTINGTDIITNGEITSMEVSQDGVLSGSFMNTGNCYYRLSVEALIKDKDGNVAKNVTSTEGVSVPSVPFNFKISLNKDSDLVSGQYQVEIKVVRKDGTVMDSSEATLEV